MIYNESKVQDVLMDTEQGWDLWKNTHPTLRVLRALQDIIWRDVSKNIIQVLVIK